MIKKKKIINILLVPILLITMNLLFILNGCGSTNTMDEESQSITSNESDISDTNSSKTTTNENITEETEISKNENNVQVNDTIVEKEQTNSEEISDEPSEEEPYSLRSTYQSFIESGKPSILVFSYDADCCASTKAFFDDYNGMAKKLLEEYKSKYNTLFINIGILDENNMSTAIEIAAQYEALNMPSILILDKTGKAYKVIEGLFDEAEVKQILDGI